MKSSSIQLNREKVRKWNARLRLIAKSMICGGEIQCQYPNCNVTNPLLLDIHHIFSDGKKLPRNSTERTAIHRIISQGKRCISDLMVLCKTHHAQADHIAENKKGWELF